MAVLDTATLAEASLVLRKYGALLVSDTMFWVRAQGVLYGWGDLTWMVCCRGVASSRCGVALAPKVSLTIDVTSRPVIAERNFLPVFIWIPGVFPSAPQMPVVLVNP